MESSTMNLSCGCPSAPPSATPIVMGTLNPQTALLDAFFPGFSLFSSALHKYSSIDLTLYVPLLLTLGALVFASRYVQTQAWTFFEDHFVSCAEIRLDDEIYNMVMSWVANQKFAKRSRRFVANTDLNSRSWSVWRWDSDEDEESTSDDVGVEFDADGNVLAAGKGNQKEKKVHFTPSFGSHYFWYKSRLLMFRRMQDTRQTAYGAMSEREEVSICSWGRNPAVLKDLLDECRRTFLNKDETRTIIYRGGVRPGTTEPAWTRCRSRVSRPFSTVVLDEQVKERILEDMRRYLHPHCVRWYSNRGIPYRRGYLLYGPPGTGKSSLSFAIAGYFKLKIYIVSLNSHSMDEEKLSTLFAELPKQCVVLLEDIDTAGLTHARRDASSSDPTSPTTPEPLPEKERSQEGDKGKISLSALLNIIDGVASAEGRVLIMTTNHIEKLDPALIRPGRVDMKIKFDLANASVLKTIFKSIFAVLEGDYPAPSAVTTVKIRSPKSGLELHVADGLGSALVSSEAIDDEKEQRRREEEVKRKRKEEDDRVDALADEFASKIPEGTFSPAEIQGFLLRHKMNPEGAVGGAEAWVVEMRGEREKEKEKMEKEEKEREEKEEAEKVKEEQEKAEKEKEEKEKENEKEKKTSKKSFSTDASSDTDTCDSDSDSESEASAKRRRRRAKKRKHAQRKSKETQTTTDE